MKRYGILGAFVGGALVAAASLLLLPAQAQEGSANQAWEIAVESYSSGDKPRLAVVKHNTVTGQTLILTCDNRCDADEVWRDFEVDGPQH
jgi:formaldehyde-activating enzyme involved in methanogenesis